MVKFNRYSDDTIEYKFILIDEFANVIWESGPNRIIN